MVPHGAVEDALHAALGQTGVLAVTARAGREEGREAGGGLHPGRRRRAKPCIACRRKRPPQPLEAGAGLLCGGGGLPLLGTGKLDLRGLREAALAGLASIARAEAVAG